MANEFEFELANGQKVYTGTQLPETMPLSLKAYPQEKIRSLDDIVEIVKDSQSLDIEKEWRNEVPWFAQGRRSSCNLYMVAWMFCITHWRFTGKKIRLSPEWVYAQINGGRDGGSMLDDGMVAMLKGGMPEYTEEFYERYRMDEFSMEEQRWAKDSSEDHCFTEAYAAPTESFEQLMLSLYSNIAEGGVCGTAVHVGPNYMRSGVTAGFDKGPGNHAVAAVQLHFKTPRPKSIEDIEMKSPQSWDRGFANNGFTRLTSRHLYETGKYHATYCLRAVSSIQDVIESCLIKD